MKRIWNRQGIFEPRPRSKKARNMRTLRAAGAAMMSAWALAPAHASSPVLPPTIQALAASPIVSSQSLNLTPGPVEDRLLAIAWEDNKSHAVSFGLVRKSSHTTQTLWLTQRSDAYDLLLRQITNWQYHQQPVIALLYSQGALARQVEIFGIGKDGLQPLDQQLGEAIEWKIRRDGSFALVVYSKPHARLEPTCFDWSPKTYKLIPSHCQ
ncbi:hypothetical protein JVX91_18180 [Pseudomonas sp. PDNC002]|uniref:hypothetical protein n=1 Tax=Pseudomonas sp. PDNC002 TaxID=2811422 RepID=UPI0019635CC3|nr:hypothetical protein [Pseudomonas sp. PDNC002]QRY77527.1 hypothetical protein JVX91_18180 [Pseudomonas sp. PDNC002]